MNRTGHEKSYGYRQHWLEQGRLVMQMTHEYFAEFSLSLFFVNAFIKSAKYMKYTIMV